MMTAFSAGGRPGASLNSLSFVRSGQVPSEPSRPISSLNRAIIPTIPKEL